MSPLFKPAFSPYPTDIRSLTSLRFIACLMVILFHFYQIHPNPGPIIRLFSGGYLWVDFFFILSGFILSHAYADDLGQQKISARFYYLKRLGRIYPVHLFTLLVFAGIPLLIPALDILEHKENGTRTFAHNIFLLHAWGFSPGPSFNAPSWSISAEWFAYLLFPALLTGQNKYLKKPGIFLGCAFLLLLSFWLAGLVLLQKPLTNLTWNWGIGRIVPEFILGMALYQFGRCYSFPSPRHITIPAAIMVMGAVIFSFPPILCTLLFGLLIIISAEQSRQGHKTILERSLPVWLGEISYSLYMIHILTISAFFVFLQPYGEEKLEPGLLVPVMYGSAVLVSVAAAALMFYLIEKPGRRVITAIAIKMEQKL